MSGYDYELLKEFIGKQVFVRLQFGRAYFGKIKNVTPNLIVLLEFRNGKGAVNFPAYEIRELRVEESK